jgi:hypothetical protein
MNWQKYFLDMGSMVNRMSEGKVRNAVIGDIVTANCKKSWLFRGSSVAIRKLDEDNNYALRISIGWARFLVVLFKATFMKKALSEQIKAMHLNEEVNFKKINIIP